MHSNSTEHDGDTPDAVYSRSLRELKTLQARDQRRATVLGFTKLALAGLTVALVVALLHRPGVLGLVLLPVAAFALLAVRQEKTLQIVRHRTRAIQFYERGLGRLNGSWAGSGETGERFLDPLHPYARDLDLFGKGSLFELLCSARTRAGEETLASWLLAGAPLEEVRARQQAVAELRSRVGLRQTLWSLGETVRLGVRPATLAAWGEGKPLAGLRTIRVLTSTLAAAWVLSLVGWGVYGWGGFALVMTLANVGYSFHVRRRLDEAAAGMEAAAGDLQLLAAILEVLEQERFLCPKLLMLQSALNGAGMPPSAAIRRLRRRAQWLESRRNPLAGAFDLVTFWSAQLVLLTGRWQQRFGPAVRGWLAAVGEFEAIAALSGFAYEHPDDVFPRFVEQGALFAAEGFAHPLLPEQTTARNDLSLDAASRLMILSGPNMAGKSTFIRSVGVNVVLAQCGATVRARRLTLSPLAVAASICILDSLQGGASRFYAEIRRIKLIAELTDGPRPVLFLMDELLSGTNSHDRLAGTEFIVSSLLLKGAIGMVSTHDLALTRLPETLGPTAVNCHFEDRLDRGELTFDYKLKEGVVQTSNALELMRAIGLSVPDRSSLATGP